MAKLLFIPVSVGGACSPGFISKKIFDQIWGLFDQHEPPDSKHRDIDWSRKLLLAAAVQGAIFRAAKEASDHYSHRAFYARPREPGPARSVPEDEYLSPVARKPGGRRVRKGRRVRGWTIVRPVRLP